MPPVSTTHPSAQELSAFSLGKLTDNAAEAVARHIEGCEACRQAVASAPPDSFLGLVRSAKPRAPSAPGEASRSRQGSLLGNPASAAPPEDVPPELAEHPRFQIVRELGRGGMGVVYHAQHRLMERSVAIKVISKSVLDHPEALARFRGEVRAAAQLQHPNIVAAYDAEQAGDLHMLMMEYVEGLDLAKVLEKKGPLPVAHACHYIRQAALGLQHAFEQGMVHRDIKPQNLMLTPKGQVKILDFGLARLARGEKRSAGLTQMGAFMGTPEFVAPEQATDARTADIRADIYSLGCTLYCLLAGRTPFTEETAVKQVLAQIEKTAQPLHEVRPDVPAELSEVVARMLAKDPAQRFQTPVEVAQALLPFCKPGQKAAGKPVAPSPDDVALPNRGTRMPGDTSRVSVPRKDVAPKQAMMLASPVGTEESPFADPAAAPPGSKLPVAKPQRSARRRKMLAATAATLLVLGSLLAGVIIYVQTDYGTIKIEVSDYVQTDYGTIRFEVNDPGVTIQVDGNEVMIRERGEPIKLRAGKHGLLVQRDGLVVKTLAFEVRRGDNELLEVTLEPLQPPLGPTSPVPDPIPSTPSAGVLVVEVNEPSPEVYVDGKKVTGAWVDGGKRAEIRLEPGTHKVEFKKDGLMDHTEEVSLQEGERRVIPVQLVKTPPTPRDQNSDFYTKGTHGQWKTVTTSQGDTITSFAAAVSSDGFEVALFYFNEAKRHELSLIRRDDLSHPFGGPTKLIRVNGVGRTMSPAFAEDDLALYFARRDVNDNRIGYGTIWKADRKSKQDPFENPQPVTGLPEIYGGWAVSPNGLIFLYTPHGSPHLHRADRQSTREPFHGQATNLPNCCPVAVSNSGSAVLMWKRATSKPSELTASANDLHQEMRASLVGVPKPGGVKRYHPPGKLLDLPVSPVSWASMTRDAGLLFTALDEKVAVMAVPPDAQKKIRQVLGAVEKSGK